MKKSRKRAISLILALVLLFSALMINGTSNAMIDTEKTAIALVATMTEVVEEGTNIAEYVNAKKADFVDAYGDIFEAKGYDVDDLFDAEGGIYTEVLGTVEGCIGVEMVEGEPVPTMGTIIGYVTATLTTTGEEDFEWVEYTVTFDTDGKGSIESQEVYAIDTPDMDIDYYYNEYVNGIYMDPEFTIPYMGQAILEDTTLYVDVDLIGIKEVNITAAIPTVGTTVEIEKYEDDYYDWGSQTNKPLATVPGGVGYYFVDEDGDSYSYWLTGFDEEGYDTPFTGTFQYDTDYYAERVLYANSGYIFTDDVAITVNGVPADEIFYNSYTYLSLGTILTTPEEPAEYSFLDGAEQTFDKSGDEELSFRADIPLEKFQISGKAYMDGEEIPMEYATLTNGSTIITLSKVYTDELTVGEHTFKLAVSNGEVETTFNVVETKSSNPKTGDNISLFVGLFLVTVVAGYVTIKKIK